MDDEQPTARITITPNGPYHCPYWRGCDTGSRTTAISRRTPSFPRSCAPVPGVVDLVASRRSAGPASRDGAKCRRAPVTTRAVGKLLQAQLAGDAPGRR